MHCTVSFFLSSMFSSILLSFNLSSACSAIYRLLVPQCVLWQSVICLCRDLTSGCGSIWHLLLYIFPARINLLYVCLSINLMSIFITSLSPVCAPIGHLSVPKDKSPRPVCASTCHLSVSPVGCLCDNVSSVCAKICWLSLRQFVVYLCRNLLAVSASICHLSVPESVACPSIYKSPVFLCSMYICVHVSAILFPPCLYSSLFTFYDGWKESCQQDKDTHDCRPLFSVMLVPAGYSSWN
jgi:hypothetical protein